MSLTIGVDVGGTKIAGGLVDESGQVLEQAKVESPAQDAAAIVESIAEMVSTLRADRDVVGVGISAAGFIDAARATVYFAPNLAWRDEDLKGRLEESCGLTVVVENDGNSAAWGEFTYGAAVDADDLLMVAVGTGVGGGIVVDGQLYRGGFGIAGEIGHIRIEREGRQCGCGQRGCLEQYGSGTSLETQARAAATKDARAASAVLELAGGDVEAIEGPMITEAAKAGDAFAIARLAELGGWLGEGAAQLAAVIDPGVIVLGGGVAEAGDLVLEPMRTTYEAQLTGSGHRPVAELRLATLGNTAGLIGAADLARR
ncbi:MULTISPECIES: ROK family glucokinase [unclassified Nocardioides]|uniref:ROK family glucokinase n=1 Tax=unclassified Nocardioides TaxID=2615069 RepID=UPI0006FFD35D|nr:MULTISPECIES: ROK family glucokinase [unclassified Nocardioides]KQY63928.1 glucokinase [Nocardioides sp. Root140]KQZ69846.1 glucokinase [Nocardioides sp. Root151]KRF15942.1 glucokinase [Nocardioides sp. Soil796]